MWDALTEAVSITNRARYGELEPAAGPAPAPGGLHRQMPDAPLLSRLLVCVLDELDYGIVLVGGGAQLLYANHRARQLLHGDSALRCTDGVLGVRDPRDKATFGQALADATGKGLRRLVVLGRSGDSHRLDDSNHSDDSQRAGHSSLSGPAQTHLLAALVPVQAGIAAVLLGRSGVCEELSMQCYARSHALTAAESRVLSALGRGVTPTRYAREQGVKLSTVRTQLGAIRQKTGAASLVELMRVVAALPPMVNALRV
jgi:DNA-binding CsgD family transcriptional regulator